MKRFIVLISIAILILVQSPKATAQGGAFLIMDARDGAVLAQENGASILPMASTTKIMTALVVLEHGTLKDRIRIPSQAVGVEGSSLYLKCGDIYTVEELLYGLMLRSANDCAEALAWYIGKGNRDVFLALMNQKAKELGLSNTVFKNPSGLPEEGHYTTAHELAFIMRAAMKNEQFSRIVSEKSRKIGDQIVVNHNKLLSLYEPCVGGKTGYTKEAGRCLVTVAKKKGVMLICVTLGQGDDWNRHTQAYEKWFDRIRIVSLVKAGDCRVDLPKAGGGSALAINSHEIFGAIFSENQTFERVVIAPRYLYGERMSGDVVGTIEYRLGGILIGESPLILKQDVHAKMKKEWLIGRLFRFFRQIFLKK